MTNEKRIAAAATELGMWVTDAHEGRVTLDAVARAMLGAAVPELFPAPGEQPTHWLAPWSSNAFGDERAVHWADWNAMRDSYLAEPPKP